MKCETACIDYQTPNPQNFKKTKMNEIFDKQPHILFILADDYGQEFSIFVFYSDLTVI